MKLEIFKFKENEVRTQVVNGEPYFVGKDVAEILGYSNTAKAIRDHIDEDDKRTERIVHPQGGTQETIIINESGLYSLILKSKLPQAKEFKRWVTSEVLPNIRKHGAYMTEQTLENALTSPDFLIKLANKLKEEKDKNLKLETTVAVQNQQLQELQPKATYYDLVLQNKSLISITKIAKDFGLSGKKLNQILKNKKVQYKQGNTWILYSEYADRGYTHSKTVDVDGGEKSVLHTNWTQKGRLFIYELLKGMGIKPVVER